MITIVLTEAGGSEIYINLNHIVAMKPIEAGQAKTVIMTTNGTFEVKETIASFSGQKFFRTKT